MLQSVPLEKKEGFSPIGSPIAGRHIGHEKHQSSAILEIEPGSGLYSTFGTRDLDALTTPAECVQMISDHEHLPTITLIKRLCMEHGRFVAFVPRMVKFMLQERHAEGNWILDENRIIEGRRSLLRNLLSRVGVMDPNLEPSEMPDDWDLTVNLTGEDGNCAPFFASVWNLVNTGALRIVGKTNQGVILEPTEKLFGFIGNLEEEENNENPDLAIATA